MKRTVAIILSITVLLIFSCNKEKDTPPSPPERNLSVPEKVEKEIMDLLSKDWKSLSDTLAYFDSTLLSKGILRGKGPDGVFYELCLQLEDTAAIRADFKVEDSIWVSVKGRFIPLDISLCALETEIAVKKDTPDSTALRLSNVKVVAPDLFFYDDNRRAALLYDGSRVGFITREDFENADYSTGVYPVVHYYNDPRTFAFYDKGLADLLKKLKFTLTDVLK